MSAGRTPARSGARDLAGLAVWLGLSFAAAAAGAAASARAGEFYAVLQQPPWAPPGWLFAPVWTALYASMGIAAWLVWRQRPLPVVWPALTLFVVQLAVNALWSWLFFAWGLGAAAFADIVLLWTMVAILCVAFWRIRRLAGAILLPYLAWVSFAAVLAYAVWQLNPALLGT